MLQAGRAFKREALRRGQWQSDPDIMITQVTLAKIFDELDFMKLSDTQNRKLGSSNLFTPSVFTQSKICLEHLFLYPKGAFSLEE